MNWVKLLFYQWPFIITDATPFIIIKCSFQLACSTRPMQMHIYSHLYCYRYLRFFFHTSVFVLYFVKWLMLEHLLHNCSHKPIFTVKQEVFQDSFIKAGNCVSLCVHSSLHSMLKYFQTQHFPRTLCPLPYKLFIGSKGLIKPSENQVEILLSRSHFRLGQLHLNSGGMCPDRLRKDLDFWRISEFLLGIIRIYFS